MTPRALRRTRLARPSRPCCGPSGREAPPQAARTTSSRCRAPDGWPALSRRRTPRRPPSPREDGSSHEPSAAIAATSTSRHRRDHPDTVATRHPPATRNRAGTPGPETAPGSEPAPARRPCSEAALHRLGARLEVTIIRDVGRVDRAADVLEDLALRHRQPATALIGKVASWPGAAAPLRSRRRREGRGVRRRARPVARRAARAADPDPGAVPRRVGSHARPSLRRDPPPPPARRPRPRGGGHRAGA